MMNPARTRKFWQSLDKMIPEQELPI
jgi:hypothetical protein